MRRAHSLLPDLNSLFGLENSLITRAGNRLAPPPASPPARQSGVVIRNPWGKRRYPNGADDPNNAIASLTNRGYTGHEHLEELALAHMNGRIHDPLIGRFASADPFVQDRFSTNAFNRYAYGLNNPLAYTEPSGYLLETSVHGTEVIRGVAEA